MGRQGLVRRRCLPHIDVDGSPFFITACLNGSISEAGLARVRSYRRDLSNRARPVGLPLAEWETVKAKLVFKLVDSLLDGSSPVHHFDDHRLAEVVQSALFYFADQRYKLLAYVIMPSHLHWVFLPDGNWSATASQSSGRTPREMICHSIQSFTANACNRILKRTGAFWQSETYDHYARDEDELARIIRHVEQNPVVAGIVVEACNYQWSSARVRKELKLGPFDVIPRDAT